MRSAKPSTVKNGRSAWGRGSILADLYFTGKLRMDTFKKIGEQYEIDNGRTVRSVFERMKNRLTSDRGLAWRIERLQDSGFD